MTHIEIRYAVLYVAARLVEKEIENEGATSIFLHDGCALYSYSWSTTGHVQNKKK